MIVLTVAFLIYRLSFLLRLPAPRFNLEGAYVVLPPQTAHLLFYPPAVNPRPLALTECCPPPYTAQFDIERILARGDCLTQQENDAKLVRDPHLFIKWTPLYPHPLPTSYEASFVLRCTWLDLASSLAPYFPDPMAVAGR